MEDRPAPHAHPPARSVILRIWHADPLRCLVWHNPLRVIAVIDDPRMVHKILLHLASWHDPPARASPPDPSGPYTCEPCDHVDPTRDDENVLTN